MAAVPPPQNLVNFVSTLSQNSQQLFQLDDDNALFINKQRSCDFSFLQEQITAAKEGNTAISVSGNTEYGNSSILEQVLETTAAIYPTIVPSVLAIFRAIKPFICSPTNQPLTALSIELKLVNERVSGAELKLGPVNKDAITKLQPGSFTYAVIHTLVDVTHTNTSLTNDHELVSQQYYQYLCSAANTYNPATATENYNELCLALRKFVGITEEGMKGIIKAISALLIVGNIGFQQQSSSIILTSRKFHSFPEGLEICEDLLDLEPGRWVELQDILTTSATSLNHAELMRDWLVAEIYYSVVKYIVSEANRQLELRSKTQTSSLLLLLTPTTLQGGTWDSFHTNYIKEITFNSALVPPAKKEAETSADSLSRIALLLTEFEALFTVVRIHEVLESTRNLAIIPRISDSPLRDALVFGNYIQEKLRSSTRYFLRCVKPSANSANSIEFYTFQLEEEGISLILRYK